MAWEVILGISEAQELLQLEQVRKVQMLQVDQDRYEGRGRFGVFFGYAMNSGFN